MELKELTRKYEIIGIISNYRISINNNTLIRSLFNQNKIESALKIMNLSNDILDKKFGTLNLYEQTKVDLLTKINKDVIVVGNLSNNLIYKDREEIKKILKKLIQDFHKKIIIIDDDITVLMDICSYYIVLKDHRIIYKTANVYDDVLYKYINMPKIISFVKKANKKNALLKEYIDIYELIKAIYRSKS